MSLSVCVFISASESRLVWCIARSLVATPGRSAPTASRRPHGAHSTSNSNPANTPSLTVDQSGGAPKRSTDAELECASEAKPGGLEGAEKAGTADFGAIPSQLSNQTHPAVSSAPTLHAPYSQNTPARSFMELIKTDTRALSLLGMPTTKPDSECVARPDSRGERASDADNNCMEDLRELADAELLGPGTLVDTPVSFPLSTPIRTTVWL